MKTKRPTVYIMTNKVQGILYVGVTSNLIRRVTEHKEGTGSTFTSKYHCYLLVWYQSFETMFEAISVEKLLKMKSRLYKLQLIESKNSAWDDFSRDLSQ
jgi:putative endonuclease